MKFVKPLFWKSKNIISIILYPLSLIVLIINELKELNLKKKFFIKTICVGNTYLGGTGKTSLAIEIQSLVKKIGRLIYKPFGINLHIKTGPGIKNYVSDPNFDAEAFSNQLKL